MKPWIRYWWPAVAWAAVVFFFSTESFSGEETQGWIYAVLQWMFPHASPRALQLGHHAVRKLAHVTEYFILSLLVLRGIRGGRAGWHIQWALAALLICAAYAVSDEWHQSFVPSRGSALGDVLFDSGGAGLAQLWAWWRARRGRA